MRTSHVMNTLFSMYTMPFLFGARYYLVTYLWLVLGRYISPMKTRSYKEVVDFVISQILMASSNVRSVSLITPRGTLRQFRMREDVNLLLNTKEMGELVKSINSATSSFYKFLPKLGLLRHFYLDFEDLHALVFPLPDRNTLFIALEKMEQDIPRLTKYIIRLLQQNEMIYDYE
jgi:hypothetical protein